MPIASPRIDALLLGGADNLELEIRAERAGALERAAVLAETAVAAYRAAAAAGPQADLQADPQAKPLLLKAAAEALYGYVVQRELMGFRGHGEVFERLAAPREVVARLGAR